MFESFRTRALFRDRIEAGERLAGALEKYRDPNLVVLGIPRGGVPVAAEVARRMDAELDIIVARKLGAPGNPELAIGAVTANGGEFVDEDMIRRLDVPGEYLAREIEDKRGEAERRQRALRGFLPEIPLDGRTVVVIDDGLATGATMRAALRSVRRKYPRILIAAVPVGSRHSCLDLAPEADDVVCPEQPDFFGSVGLCYDQFEQVPDAEVRRVLEEARSPKR